MKTFNRGYFEQLYARNDDPWSFRTSDYEREKYDRTLATLNRRYARALEIGCSIGVMTRRLAERCDVLLGVDISARAVELAGIACRDLSNVTVMQCDVTRDYPPGPFDFVVVSEVAYYWSTADFADMRTQIFASLTPDGEVLAVHFLPKETDGTWGGDAVHEAFLSDRRYRAVRSVRRENYRIDLLRTVRSP